MLCNAVVLTFDPSCVRPLRRPRYERAVTAFAAIARQQDFSYRRGCRAKLYKGSNFLTIGHISKKNVGKRILHTVLKFRSISLVSTKEKRVQIWVKNGIRSRRRK